MKKYLPALLAAILSGMTLNSAFAADTSDVDAVTMDVIEHSDPHAVTNDIQLPDEASQEARDHVAGADNDNEHEQEANAESHDSAQEDAHSDSQAEAQDDAHEDSQSAAQEQAHDAMQDATDASTSKGD